MSCRATSGRKCECKKVALRSNATHMIFTYVGSRYCQVHNRQSKATNWGTAISTVASAVSLRAKISRRANQSGRKVMGAKLPTTTIEPPLF